MKIALIYEKFISRGGLENYLYRFADQLIKNSHELVVITGESDPETSRLPNTDIRLISRRSLSRFARGAEELLPSLTVDASIGFGRTVAHDLHRAGGGCHQFYSDHVLHPLKRASRKNRTELALERELYTSGKTRHFVVNSQMVAEQLQAAYSLSADRISVIPTAVDAKRFCPADSPQGRSELRADVGEAPVFLFVSMNHRRKGLDALLQAWPMVPDAAQLWIVGAALSSRYRRAIKRERLEGRVREIVTPPNLTAYYQAADFFIHPTLYDACANTVLQSMACGLPGIISEQDGARQFVDEGETGLLLPHPTDPDAIAARALQMLLVPPEERQRMANNARNKILQLTWPKHVAEWESLIGTISSE